MARKGMLPIPLPKGVEVKMQEGVVTVKGPKTTLTQAVKTGIEIKIEDGNLFVFIKEGGKDLGQFHGLYWSLIKNMVTGVSKGFEKRLEMIGVGYRAAVQGTFLDLQIGFSHPTKQPIPQGVHVVVEKNTEIVITGADFQKVGQFAASVRAMRPPEPYQGKGIRYKGEYVRKKAGKSASKK